MNKKDYLYIDQYGTQYVANSVSMLREKVGGGRVEKMYVDLKNGQTKHIGYIIKGQWLRAYTPFYGDVK